MNVPWLHREHIQLNAEFVRAPLTFWHAQRQRGRMQTRQTPFLLEAGIETGPVPPVPRGATGGCHAGWTPRSPRKGRPDDASRLASTRSTTASLRSVLTRPTSHAVVPGWGLNHRPRALCKTSRTLLAAGWGLPLVAPVDQPSCTRFDTLLVNQMTDLVLTSR